MHLTLFTATGCLRCTVLKRFLDGRKSIYEEKDVKEAGKADFVAFYAQNRGAIRRKAEGVGFPILVDGAEIRQGLGPSLAYLLAGKAIDGFIKNDTLAKEWIDGFSVSGGDPDRREDFLAVLRHLKGCGMKAELQTDGRQAGLLEKICRENLAGRLVMDVLGPMEVYRSRYGNDRLEKDIQASMKMAQKFSEYRFRLVIATVFRDVKGMLQSLVLTPEKIGQAARMIKEATGSDRHPCFVAPALSLECKDRNKTGPAVSSSDLFRYRTEARRFQVLTEIEKHH